ncbi:undecaprenyl/decaprenyl-phosphate alpha-N-acetylglucosaminyl 1-phosphate transferase [Paenibacillus pasadenensis]|uniref:MraY family glycosyltransferase n=1 Tax=Paenibacillus pasadenensis TaxID=217090 RepID=UPI00203AE86F|nr:MraY family glycosyltransferase [Paenibacillus pasadenensis]MCM3749299.1 undecaprenyl/decaprenyl-phosphate alpha-N-acetylglucosaminyl 1-phosphate transferase [Paenibacillus pasadenensis]
MSFLVAFILAFAIVVALIPPLRTAALRIGFVDKPRSDSARKIHREPIPLTAGIAIFIGFTVVYLLFVRDSWIQSLAILGGGLLILLIGIVDDWYKTNGKEFPALPKMAVQLSAAVLVYLSGIVFSGFENPFNGTYVTLPDWLSFLFTVLWIFGVTTVINFSDGMDGLAGGLSAISATTLLVVALVMGLQGPAMMAVITAGVCAGYLLFNRPPAKVFMGDAGATFLGFMLGVIALDGAFKQATLLSLFIPILSLGVPILDNVRVVISRIRNGVPIYKADASQAHYRLLAAGLKPVQVVSFLFLVNICFGLFSIVLLLAQ